MATTLNSRAFDNAKELVLAGRFVYDERDAWSEHQPAAADEDRFLTDHDYVEYGRWFLGIDDGADAETKRRYKFPYGDFDKLHRCALLAAEVRAGQRRYRDIELAVAHLHGMVDALHDTGRARSC